MLYILSYWISFHDQKGQVGFCHHLVSFVSPSINLLHNNLLLWNHLSNLNQSCTELFVRCLLSTLYPKSPSTDLHSYLPSQIVGVEHTDRPCNKTRIPPNCLRFWVIVTVWWVVWHMLRVLSKHFAFCRLLICKLLCSVKMRGDCWLC